MSDPAPTPLARVRELLKRAKDAAFGLSGPARVLALGTVGAALLLAGWLVFRGAMEPYASLFAQLDPEDAAAVVTKLKEQKIPYRIGGDGTRIEVPENKVHEIRLELAGSGLPRGGSVGFEGFDKMRLGATEFEQRVMFRRAMEGELARTISSVAAVQSARVHLVLGEKSVFAARREPASASVVLKLRPGRQLGPSEVAGIVHLVASAVPGLVADHVTLVSTDGAMLHRPRGGPGDEADEPAGGAADERLARARQLEVQFAERAQQMLDRILGTGHADVRVTVDLDLARVERTEDRYNTDKSALRSEERTLERTSAGDDTVTGVPGAESNLPTGAAPAEPAGGESGIVRESHTRNFEIDHVSEKRVLTTGTVRRLTVAVALDGTSDTTGAVQPRQPEDVDKLASLVKSAVGFDELRGDLITVESLPFPVAEPEPAPVVEPALLPAPVRKYLPFASVALCALVVLATLLLVRRSRKNAAQAMTLRIAETAGGKPAELLAPPGAAPAELLPPVETPALEAKRASARDAAIRRATEDPATAAMVLRHWLGTSLDERNDKAA